MIKKHLFECQKCGYQWPGKPADKREQVRNGRVKCPSCRQWRAVEIAEEVPAEIKKRKSEAALVSAESKLKPPEERSLDDYYRLIKKLKNGQELESGLVQVLGGGGAELDDIMKLYLIQQMTGESQKSSESGLSTLLETQQNQISDLQKSLRDFMTSRIAELQNRPSMLQELQMAKALSGELGYSRGGRSTLDVVSEGVSKLDQRAKQGLRMIEPYAKREFKPKVSRTLGERREKAREIEGQISKSKELLEAENELVRAYDQVQGTHRQRFSRGELRASS